MKQTGLCTPQRRDKKKPTGSSGRALSDKRENNKKLFLGSYKIKS